MKPSVFVFDNFYLEPDEVRHIALNDFEWEDEKVAGPYAGLNSIHPYCEEFHEDFMGNCTNAWPVNPTVFGHFRMSRKDSSFKQYIHCNPGVSWIGVIYLSKGYDDIPGTVFWRHKRTGLTHAPTDPYKYHQYGNSDASSSLNWFNNIDGVDESLWIKSNVISFQYNRLVLFRGDAFHSHGDLFGSNDDDSRLLQIFQWNAVDKEYEWWSKQTS